MNKESAKTPRTDTNKDKSLVHYGYEDKSAGAMKHDGDSAYIDPEAMF